jgi:hypothetical protein
MTPVTKLIFFSTVFKKFVKSCSHKGYNTDTISFEFLYEQIADNINMVNNKL